MNVNFAKRAAIVAGTAALGVVVVAGAAQADPPAGVHRTLVGVGSDTTQDVLNGLSNAILDPNPTGSSDGYLIASYDATGTSAIATRDSGCQSVVRPDGSGAGVKALRDDIAAGTHCLDFARSSSAPNANGQFDFIPFGVDAVTLAVKSGSTIGGNVTLADLKHAYNCQDSTGAALPAGTFPKLNGVTVHPLVPQSGSGTRKFWASTLGFNATTLPSCVSDVAKNGASVQEHNGNALQRTAAADGAEDVMPFSIAQYIAQGRGISGVTDRRNGAVLETIGGVSPTNASGNLNTAFPINREVYNVIPHTRVTESLIKDTFIGANSEVCTALFSGSTSVINEYGFGTDTNCGAQLTALTSKDLV